jgi:hypothetical protein
MYSFKDGNDPSAHSGIVNINIAKENIIKIKIICFAFMIRTSHMYRLYPTTEQRRYFSIILFQFVLQKKENCPPEKREGGKVWFKMLKL